MTSPAGGGQYQQGAGAPGTPHGPKITSVFDFTAEALEQLAFWLEQRGLHIPIQQILGYERTQTSGSGTDASTASTASTTYTSVGPSLTINTAGKYLVFVRASMSQSPASSGGDYAVSADGGTTFIVGVTDAGQANLSTHAAFEITNISSVPATLNGYLKSRNAAATASAEAREIVAVRIGEVS